MEFKVSVKYPHLEVSECGVVRRTRDKFSFKVKKPTKAGYFRITGKENGTRYNVFIHSLVAESWVDGFVEGLVVNHINGDKADNRASNLEWVTQGENVRHAQLNNLTTSRYTVDELREVCRLLESGLSTTQVSKATGVVPHTVQDIKCGKWKAISGEYNIPKAREKPSEDAVRWVCDKLRLGWKNVKIERESPFPCVTRSTVSGIKNKLYFTDISNQYF